MFCNSRRHKSRKIRCILVGTCLFIALMASCQLTYALEDSGWENLEKNGKIEKKDSDAKERVVVEKGKISYKADIESFDVSDDKIVITFTDNTLGVFDKQMKLRSAYKMDIGDAFCDVLLHNGNIVLFPSRHSFATEIDCKGNFVCTYDISNYDLKTLYCIRNQGTLFYMSVDKTKLDGQATLFSAPYLIKETDRGTKKVLYG